MVNKDFDSQDWETRPLGQAYAIRHGQRVGYVVHTVRALNSEGFCAAIG